MRTFEGAAVSKKQREVSGEPEGQYRNAPEWRGPCCEGFHWWGHGAGYAVKNAATECEWRCMESRCRKKLEKKVPEAEYKKWNDQCGRQMRPSSEWRKRGPSGWLLRWFSEVHRCIALDL